MSPTKARGRVRVRALAAVYDNASMVNPEQYMNPMSILLSACMVTCCFGSRGPAAPVWALCGPSRTAPIDSPFPSRASRPRLTLPQCTQASFPPPPQATRCTIANIHKKGFAFAQTGVSRA